MMSIYCVYAAFHHDAPIYCVYVYEACHMMHLFTVSM